jgi:hypothetical protein
MLALLALSLSIVGGEPVPSAPMVTAWNYDLASGELKRGEVSPLVRRPSPAPGLFASFGGTAVDFDNTAANGFTILPGAGVGLLDWGTYTPAGNGLLHRFTVGYSTASNTPIDLTVRLYSGTVGGCQSTGALIATFPLSGLPASDGVSPAAHTISVDTRTLGLVVPPGPLGWEYRFFDVKSGPLLVDGPLGLPAPNGTVDAYDRFDLLGGGCSTVNFGCLPPFLPCASFYFALEADNGTVTSGALNYGSGLNPPGSLLLLSGNGSIGALTVLGVTNPLATQPPGSIALLAVSVLPDPNFPAGTPLPGFGMSAPASFGELLIALPQELLLGPSIWAGPGFPSAFPIGIPLNTNLIGAQIHFQGLIVDPPASLGVPFGLTEGLRLTIGP